MGNSKSKNDVTCNQIEISIWMEHSMPRIKKYSKKKHVIYKEKLIVQYQSEKSPNRLILPKHDQDRLILKELQTAGFI